MEKAFVREVTGIEASGSETGLRVHAIDEPGADGAQHVYDVTGFDTRTNPGMQEMRIRSSNLIVPFQIGPARPPGGAMNGITDAVLLAIVRDRLAALKRRPLACVECAEALLHVEGALFALHRRGARVALERRST